MRPEPRSSVRARSVFLLPILVVVLCVACTGSSDEDADSGQGAGEDVNTNDDAGWTADTQDTQSPDQQSSVGDGGAPPSVWGNCVDDTGNPGCPCTGNDTCNSGFCIETPDGKLCTDNCVELCPQGYACSQAPGQDTVLICVPKHPVLCDPCTASKDCQTVYGGDHVCVDYGDLGAYCGSACVQGGDCPSGYDCLTSKTVEDTTTKQCIKTAAGGDAGNGQCACSKSATAKAKSTSCTKTVSEPDGKYTCKGTRVCGENGLTACDAQPQAEKCDGLDNDCNGKVDDDVCNDDEPCTVDSCDKEEMTCASVPVIDKTPCDDGSLCTSKDACQAGTCLGTEPLECDDGNECTADGCDPKSGCTSKVLNKPCDDGDACTTGDTCKEGKCASTTTDKLCDDNNGCTADACDQTKGCLNTVIQSSCDDGNACTVGDKCGSAGGKAVCLPGAASKTCDDSNQCTTDNCIKTKGCMYAPSDITLPCYDGPKKTEGVGICVVGTAKCGGGQLGKCNGSVVPAGFETCDGKDNDCNGQTDETCTPAGLKTRLGWVSIDKVAGKGKSARRVQLRGSFEPVGAVEGTKLDARFGWLIWLFEGGK